MRPSFDDANLSPREIEVLIYVKQGYTNKIIANKLDVCKKTIEFHLKNIYQKINVINKIEAAIWAAQHIKD